MSHHPVMDRLAHAQANVSPDRSLVDAIHAWEADPQDLGLLAYTGMDTAELAAVVVDERSVGDLLAARSRRSTN